MTRRTVLVTGASGHLGRAVVAHFAARGDRLVLLDHHLGALPDSHAGPDDGLALAVDLRDADATRAAVAQAEAGFGGIDVACHLAGGFRMGAPVHATPDADWDFLFDLNTASLRHLARAVVPGMMTRGHGCIVTVGAHAALRGQAGMGAYAASKSATIRLTESMSAELRDHGIRVNCVLPSILDTPENRAAMPDADPARWVGTEALADVIGFLASDAARAIHGAALPVTGRV